jgi:hypothetical protein
MFQAIGLGRLHPGFRRPSGPEEPTSDPTRPVVLPPSADAPLPTPPEKGRRTLLSGTFRLRDGREIEHGIVFDQILTDEEHRRLEGGDFGFMPIRIRDPEDGRWVAAFFPSDAQLTETTLDANDERSFEVFLREIDQGILGQTVAGLGVLLAYFGLWLWLMQAFG